jgi:hypothetical protein
MRLKEQTMKIRVFGTLVVILASAMLAGCGEESPSDDVSSTSTALKQAGVTTKDGANEDGSKADTAGLKGSGYCYVSFIDSCNGTFVNRSGHAVTSAGARTCQRFDGSWAGSSNWSGWCTGDISNYNGHIECN